MFDRILRLFWVIHPNTGRKDPILSLSAFCIIVCSLKFFLDGVVIHLMGHSVAFGHVDALSYGSLLTPVLGAHGYTAVRGEAVNKVDNPDGT